MPPNNIENIPIIIPISDKHSNMPNITSNKPIAFLIGLQHIAKIKPTIDIAIIMSNILQTFQIKLLLTILLKRILNVLGNYFHLYSIEGTGHSPIIL